MIPDSTITKSKRANDSALWRTRTIDGFGGYVSLYSDRNDMDQLSVRLRTFVLWPSWAPGSVDRGQLAEAGFYYTGEADEVRCYCCRESFAGWKDGDVPLDVHRRRSPTCHVVADLDRKHPSLRPPPPSFSNARVDEASVKLPADVQTDGPSGKSPAEDLVDVDLRQMNISSRSAPAPVTTTRESKPDKAKLREENRRLRAELVCRQCQTDRVETLFLPCRHLVACQRCGDHMDDCIKCGQKILGTVRTYIL